MQDPIKSPVDAGVPSGSCDPSEANWIDIDPTNTVQHKWEVATIERWIRSTYQAQADAFELASMIRLPASAATPSGMTPKEHWKEIQRERDSDE